MWAAIAYNAYYYCGGAVGLKTASCEGVRWMTQLLAVWCKQPGTPGQQVQAPPSLRGVGLRPLDRCLLRHSALVPRSKLALLTYADCTARLDCTKTKNVARATSRMHPACTQGAKGGSGWVGVPQQLAHAHWGATLSA